MGKTLRWLSVLAFVLSLACVVFPAYGQDLDPEEEVVGEEGAGSTEGGEDLDVGGLEGEDMSAEDVAEDVETTKALEAQVGAEEAKRQAEAALAAGDHELAIAKLKDAAKLVPDDEQTLERLKDVQKAYVYELLRTGKYTDVLVQADDFLSRFTDPDDRAVIEVKSFRETAAQKIKEAPSTETTEAPVMAGSSDTELLAQAIQAYRKKDYDVARELLLDAREVNPYNVEIDRWLERVYYQTYLHQRAVRDTRRLEMVSQTLDVWNRRPRRPTVEVGPITPPAEPEETESRKRILEKLETIIPEVDFTDAELREVINFLAREADVNIVIDPVVFQAVQPTAPGPPEVGPFEQPGFPPTTGGGGEESIDIPGAGTEPGVSDFAPQGTLPRAPGMGPSPGFGPDTGGGFGPSTGTMPQVGTYALPESSAITIHLTNVPLKFVLKYVLRYKNLKFVVEDYAILIIPIDYVLPEELETEIFRLSTSGIGTTSQVSAPSGWGEGGGGDGGGFGGEGGGFGGQGGGFGGQGGGLGGGGFEEELGPQRETIVEWLKRAGGVTWPRGSSIVYHQPTNTLIVTNTPTNLVLIRELINIWSKPPMQVAIEARFVELELSHDFENSFRIGMTDYLRYTRNSGRNLGTVPLHSRERVQLLLNPSSILRVSGATTDSAILDVEGILTKPEFRVLWYALDQSGYSELLSAPRVTTISGQQALIQVVEEIRYPTEYETEALEEVVLYQVEAPQFQAFSVTPSGFETREVGIRLTVTPTVSADGEVITLVLLPEVSGLLGWDSYGTPVQTVTGELVYPVQQPRFESRNVTTTVYINDGETLVIGGVIHATTTTYSDSVPFLGSIPLLGRLFRSEWESETRNNLMIFVTADLITSRGTRARQERELSEQRRRYLEEFTRGIEEGGEETTTVPTGGATTTGY
jgi:type II secretory pathway component GspD/PulD (secretin)/tetratricopeptide (TPR) repeat protein